MITYPIPPHHPLPHRPEAYYSAICRRVDAASGRHLVLLIVGRYSPEWARLARNPAGTHSHEEITIEICRTWQEADAAAWQAARRHHVPVCTDAIEKMAAKRVEADHRAAVAAIEAARAAAQAESAALWESRGLGPDPTHTAKRKWRRANRDAP